MRVVPIVVTVVAVAAVAAAAIVVHENSPVQNAGQVVGYTPPPAAQSLAVIGDSYSSGTSMGGNGDNGWPTILASLNHWQLFNHAVAGTGYVTDANGGSNDFPQQAKVVAKQNPSYVIVWGARDDLGDGTNDSSSRLKLIADGMRTTLDNLKGAGAKTGGVASSRIIVIGPTWINANSIPRTYTQMSNSEAQIARSEHVRFIPTLGQWFAGNNASFIGQDGAHPTDLGNLYLAGKIQDALSRRTRGYPVIGTGAPLASDAVPPIVPTVRVTVTPPPKTVTATTTAPASATPTVTVTVAPTATVTVLAPP